MPSGLVRARSWHARSPRELAMDRELYFLESDQDRRRSEIKRDSQRLYRLQSEAARLQCVSVHGYGGYGGYGGYRHPHYEGYGAFAAGLPDFGAYGAQDVFLSGLARERRIRANAMRTARALDVVNLQERAEQRQILQLQDMQRRQLANLSYEAGLRDSLAMSASPYITQFAATTPYLRSIGTDPLFDARYPILPSVPTHIPGARNTTPLAGLSSMTPLATSLPYIPVSTPYSSGLPYAPIGTPYTSGLPYIGPGTTRSRPLGTPAMGFSDAVLFP